MFLASNSVAMVTYCVMKMVTTCSPMVGQFFDSMVVASSDLRSGYNDPSQYKCWKLFRATLRSVYFILITLTPVNLGIQHCRLFSSTKCIITGCNILKCRPSVTKHSSIRILLIYLVYSAYQNTHPNCEMAQLTATMKVSCVIFA